MSQNHKLKAQCIKITLNSETKHDITCYLKIVLQEKYKSKVLFKSYNI